MHTILVADDSVTIQRAVEIAFDKEPFQVVKVGTGADAIARAKQLKPALVLADHNMGDKSGYDVAEALRADPDTSAIPVLMFSGSTAPYDEGRARAAGVVGHLPKPFDCQTLLDRVRNLLGVAATAPGASLPAAAPVASASSMPRPPGAPGGMPRPPSPAFGTSPANAPPSSGPNAVAPVTGVTPRGVPPSQPSAPAVASSLGSIPASAVPRTGTPQTHDPFGFGAIQSTPPVAVPAHIASSPVAAAPRPAAPAASAAPAGFSSNPFATATPIGAASAPAAAPAGGLSATSDMWTSQPQNMRPATLPVAPSISSGSSGPVAAAARGGAAAEASFDLADDVPPARAAAPAARLSTAPSSSSYAESEFLEVADIEPGDIPSTPQPASAYASTPVRPASPSPAVNGSAPPVAQAQSTSKVNLDRLAALDAAATAAVVERAAPAVAAAGGAPSKEALSEEARAIVERIAWEVVPELAEVIIREEIQRLLKAR